MKTSIFYFSGTGNTDIITNLITEHLEKKNAIVSAYRIETILKEGIDYNIENIDIIGIGYPVHAFDAPSIIHNFIESLPSGNGKKLFIYKTAADPILKGGSNAKLKEKLEEKGFEVVYEELFIMPSNVFLRYSDEVIKKLYEHSKEKARKFATSITRQKTKHQENTKIMKFCTKVFGDLEKFGARRFGKSLYVDENCIHCGKCIKNCPVSNITLDSNDDIVFKNNCMLCMRCIYICPARAIKTKRYKFFVLDDFYNLKEIAKDKDLKEPEKLPKRIKKYLNEA